MTAEQTQPLYEVLYCSTLAQNLPPTTVGAIVTRARARNAEQGITGLLVFDGMRFCQHLEGPRDAVDSLMRRIVEDPRHVEVRVAYEAPLARRRYTGFGMGLAESEGPDLMAGVHALDGEVALRHFLALLPSFDING
ncbi:blue light sensor protein [Variovorax sp. KBW07]|uniref:BLUF domain-containing protein n=1 Tax=Variovorax sp. KBW07 TaxID=2153358 RepID=UPI000F5618B3|nr:BLUF domain-containing protein [Variovorax sp. KBW07]RQO61023.1 blue light sensor protein [Variovorax sp. KBW07]